MSTATTDARALDQGVPPARYARGWHCLGLAETFRDGKPHAIWAFGGKLVVWQDSHGKLNVLDGYCRHMGGDLTQGEVKGDEVGCPFHDWRWGGDGKCKAIPYARRVPLRARTQAYETEIVNGQLFIWYDPEGSEPDREILPYSIPGIDTGEYTSWSWHVTEIEGSNCRELIDNVVGHGALLLRALLVPDQLPQRLRGPQGDPVHGVEGAPGQECGVRRRGAVPQVRGDLLRAVVHDQLAVGRLQGLQDRGHPDQHPHRHQPELLHAAVRPDREEGRRASTTRPWRSSSEKYTKMFGEGFLQDVHIWQNKVPVQNPLLCEEDGPVYQLRRWYEQFYVDQADVTPEMVERFEFEVDTTKANEYWQAEVAENLARKAEEDAAVDRPPSSGLMVSFAPTSPDTARGPAALHRGPDGRGRLPRLPGQGAGEEEQRAPHRDPVDRRGAASTATEFRQAASQPGGRPIWSACSAATILDRPGRRGRRDRDRRRRWVLSMATESFQLRVAEVVEETADARSVVFEVPSELQETFAYTPGQFLTVAVPSDQTGLAARCYSLSSAPHSGRHQITVKRTVDGYASNWIVRQPQGRATPCGCCRRAGSSRPRTSTRTSCSSPAAPASPR